MKPDNEIASKMYEAMQEVTAAVNIMSDKDLEELAGNSEGTGEDS